MKHPGAGQMPNVSSLEPLVSVNFFMTSQSERQQFVSVCLKQPWHLCSYLVRLLRRVIMFVLVLNGFS